MCLTWVVHTAVLFLRLTFPPNNRPEQRCCLIQSSYCEPSLLILGTQTTIFLTHWANFVPIQLSYLPFHFVIQGSITMGLYSNLIIQGLILWGAEYRQLTLTTHHQRNVLSLATFSAWLFPIFSTCSSATWSI